MVYNFARISLSEQGRELASLRVLGFHKSEVSAILLLELALLTLLAQPFGWALGYSFAWAMVQGFNSELYRVPLVINRETYAMSCRSWSNGRSMPGPRSWCWFRRFSRA